MRGKLRSNASIKSNPRFRDPETPDWLPYYCGEGLIFLGKSPCSLCQIHEITADNNSASCAALL